MLNYFLYFLFELFYFLIKILPAKLKCYLGKGFGSLIYYLLSSRRRVVFNNLNLALGPELSHDEQKIKDLSKRIYQQMGLILVEFSMIPDLTKNWLKESVEIEGEEYLNEALARDTGIIFYSAHFGNWELLAVILAQMGYPVNAIARAQNNPYFNEKINKIREKKGVKIIPRGMSLRRAFQILKKKQCLYILGDQYGGRKGWKIEFFGQRVSTPPGVVEIAARTGATIVPVFLIRKKWGSFKLKFFPPRNIAKDSSRQEREKLLQELTLLTEEIIRQYPEQWFWLHKRWKS